MNSIQLQYDSSCRMHYSEILKWREITNNWSWIHKEKQLDSLKEEIISVGNHSFCLGAVLSSVETEYIAFLQLCLQVELLTSL